MDTGTIPRVTAEIAVPSMWRVLVHNDDYTPMEFVVELLKHEFHKSEDDATAIMLAVHNLGAAQAGVYTKEVAQTKAQRARSLATRFKHPLMVTAEEAN